MSVAICAWVCVRVYVCVCGCVFDIGVFVWMSEYVGIRNVHGNGKCGIPIPPMGLP